MSTSDETKTDRQCMLDMVKQRYENRLTSEEMEDLVRENLELKEKLKGASDKLTNYTKIEAALQNTLVATQESAEQMKSTAEEKAELIIREANSESEKIISDAYDKLSELKRDQVSLENQRAAFLVNFRSLLESQLKLLEMIEKQTEEKGKVLTIRKKAEMTDSDVDRVVDEFKRDINQNSGETSRLENTYEEKSQSKSIEEN